MNLKSMQTSKHQSFFAYYDKLRSLLASKQDVIVYGAGSNGIKVAKYIALHQAKVLAFCDSNPNKQGNTIENIPVLSPEQAIASNLPIVIASTYYPEIYHSLTNQGVTNIYNMSLVGLAKHPLIDNINTEIAWLESRLADEQSRQQLKHLLSYLAYNNAPPLPLSDYLQYKHPRIIDDHPFNMIDAGACQGESLDLFKDRLNNQNKMLCLEPYPKNYYEMISKIKQQNYRNNVTAIEAGLWSEDTALYFSSPNQSGAHANCSIKEYGDIKVNVRSIDSLCKEISFIPSYIKMDIEGAEIEALKGAVKTIREYKPKLAICLYHDLDDLWQIPRLIDSIRHDYYMSIGHHTEGWFETVLYCY